MQDFNNRNFPSETSETVPSEPNNEEESFSESNAPPPSLQPMKDIANRLRDDSIKIRINASNNFNASWIGKILKDIGLKNYLANNVVPEKAMVNPDGGFNINFKVNPPKSKLQ